MGCHALCTDKETWAEKLNDVFRILDHQWQGKTFFPNLSAPGPKLWLYQWPNVWVQEDGQPGTLTCAESTETTESHPRPRPRSGPPHTAHSPTILQRSVSPLVGLFHVCRGKHLFTEKEGNFRAQKTFFTLNCLSYLPCPGQIKN